MNRFSIKSIILGIGIGIILASILNMIYLAGSKPEKEMTDEEIISRAEKLGMIPGSSIISDFNKISGQKTPVPSEKPPVKSLPSIAKEQTKSPAANNTAPTVPPHTPAAGMTPVKKGIIQIQPGDTSGIVAEKLYKAGLLRNKEAFLGELERLNLAGSINTGSFIFPEGADNTMIIKTITDK